MLYFRYCWIFLIQQKGFLFFLCFHIIDRKYWQIAHMSLLLFHIFPEVVCVFSLLKTFYIRQYHIMLWLHEKCSYSEFLWSIFWLNMERYSVSLRIHFECRKIRIRKTLNTDTFHEVQQNLFFSRINVDCFTSEWKG